MAIEIVPKKGVEVPSWQNHLLYFLIFLLIILVAGYFTLNYFTKKSEQKLQDVEATIKKARTDERVKLESELKELREKIDDLAPLLLSHKKTSNFFVTLEKNTHPKVFFVDLNFDTKSSSVELSGQTDDFITLGQQLLIFQKSPTFQNLKLSKVEINKEGKIKFTFNFSLNPQLFNW